jgi:hypothetical protein
MDNFAPVKSLRRDVLVTGIPRSGTTLVCTMINNLSNSICLSEPDAVNNMIEKSATPYQYIQLVEDEFSALREQIFQMRRVMNRQGMDGKQLTDYFCLTSTAKINLNFSVKEETVFINDNQFNLCIKHNAHFMCVLPQLAHNTRFSIIAIVRHPIHTMMSWRSLDLPISSGRLPAAEKFWPILRQIGESNIDILLKQVLIYEHLCQRLIELRGNLIIIKYEDLLRDPRLIESLFRQESLVQIPLKSSVRECHHDLKEKKEIFDLLKKYAPSAFTFYPDLSAPVDEKD